MFVCELDGLYASAVADAVTVMARLPQMRAKNIGKFVLCRVTVICGLPLRVKSGVGVPTRVACTPPILLC